MITLPPFGRIHCRIIHTSSVANHLDDVWSKKWMAKLDELDRANSCNSSRDITKVSPGDLPRRTGFNSASALGRLMQVRTSARFNKCDTGCKAHLWWEAPV